MNMYDDKASFETAKRIIVQAARGAKLTKDIDNIDKWMEQIAIMIDGLKIKDFF